MGEIFINGANIKKGHPKIEEKRTTSIFSQKEFHVTGYWHPHPYFTKVFPCEMKVEGGPNGVTAYQELFIDINVSARLVLEKVFLVDADNITLWSQNLNIDMNVVPGDQMKIPITITMN